MALALVRERLAAEVKDGLSSLLKNAQSSYRYAICARL
jgi:hypothetical protein